jgi:type I restriction enzyme, S subunit
VKALRWESVELGKHCSKIGSGSTPRGGDSVYQQEGVAFIRSQNVYNGQFASSGLAYLNEQQARKLKGVEVHECDVLLNITGDSVARCCLVPDTVLPARVNQHVAIIRPKPHSFEPRFLGYFLTSPQMQAIMLSLAGSGGTRKALTKEMIQRFVAPKPPSLIQERIAGVLSAFDDLIGNNRRRIALLERAARLLYEEWFVRFRFPGHERAKFINGLPSGWTSPLIGDYAPLLYGKALREDQRGDGEVPVYGSSGRVGTHNKPLVEPSGIIVGRKGNVGAVYFSEEPFWPIDTTYFVGGPNVTRFLFYALQRSQFISTDVAVPGLNRDFAHSRQLIVPNDSILSQYEEKVAPLFKMMRLLERQNTQLQAARDLLLPRLMSGEVEV